VLKPLISDAKLDHHCNILLTDVQKSVTETLKDPEINAEFKDYFVQWPGDVITKETTHVVLECIQRECDRTGARKVTEKLKAIMKLFSPALPLTTSVAPYPVCLSRMECRHPSCLDPAAPISLRCCLYCSTQQVHPELQLRSTSCPESCLYLHACISCMRKFGSYCHVKNDTCEHSRNSNTSYVSNICPDHESTIEPAIGGKNSFAMLLHDASDDIADTTEMDALNILQLDRQSS